MNQDTPVTLTTRLGHRRRGIRIVLVVGIVLRTVLSLVGSAPQDAQAVEPARLLSAKALQECEVGRVATDRAVRLAHFEHGEILARQAIELEEGLAEGHFALFCNLGEQLRIDGEGVASFFGLRRVMAAVDRTLALDPNHLGALSAKGTLLTRLPGLLGGDAEQGEAMLRRVIAEAPNAVYARIALARSCAARGAYKEALSLAEAAVEIAQAEPRGALFREALATLSELQALGDDLLIAWR